MRISVDGYDAVQDADSAAGAKGSSQGIKTAQEKKLHDIINHKETRENILEWRNNTHTLSLSLYASKPVKVGCYCCAPKQNYSTVNNGQLYSRHGILNAGYRDLVDHDLAIVLLLKGSPSLFFFLLVCTRIFLVLKVYFVLRRCLLVLFAAQAWQHG
jgi:hypothetical protein